MVEDYFAYLKLFEDGLWLRKYHPTPDLDFAAYLGGITERVSRRAGWTTPLDMEHNFLFQLGLYTQRGDRLEFVSRHFLIVMHEFRWEIRVKSLERLVSASGVEFAFHAVGDLRSTGLDWPGSDSFDSP